jgi:hypothetical protein
VDRTADDVDRQVSATEEKERVRWTRKWVTALCNISAPIVHQVGSDADLYVVLAGIDVEAALPAI